MDSAHSHPSSPPPTSTIAHATSQLGSSSNPTVPNRLKRHSEPPATRQKRLLHHRNARFPTKKLSLSNLSSRFSQLIHANDEQHAPNSTSIDQENILSDPEVNQRNFEGYPSPNSLGILNEISNSTLRKRKLRQSGNITIYQDTPERPLLECSPFSSPALYQDSLTGGPSPLGFDHIQDSLDNMRLRETSGNEFRGSPRNGSIKGTKKRKCTQVKAGFDTQEYIEHIERQLHEAQNELFSPTTNKSLKDQLRTARQEIEQLSQDAIDMRDMFEAEVKKTIEDKTEMEVELKRRVRDLEDELERKVATIEDLELQHNEKRLNDNTIDNLKAVIDKLEHDKTSLEDENRSVSRRNEVLSELLAMSPTKLHSFESKSPVREKRRAGRPMSMIIPRLPSSPNGTQPSQPASIATSPAVSMRSPLHGRLRSRGGSPQPNSYGLGLSDCEKLETMNIEANESNYDYFSHLDPARLASRRSTLQSQSSEDEATMVSSNVSASYDQPVQRVPPKRKPRKFMSGSTQLKPLLLSTLASDSSMSSSASTTTSPLLEAIPNVETELREQCIGPFHSVQDFHGQMDRLSGTSNLNDTVPGENTIATFRHLEADISGHDLRPISDVPSNTVSNEVSSDSTSPALNGTPLQYLEVTDKVLHASSYESPDVFRTSNIVAAIQAGSRRISLDLKAISQLELPSPCYDKLPNADMCIDKTLLSDIPQPLFSASSNATRRQPRRACYSAPPDHYRLGATEYMGEFNHNLRPTCPPSRIAVMHTPEAHRSSWNQSYFNTLDEQSFPSIDRNISSRQTESLTRPSLKTVDHLGRAKSPLDILRSTNLGARPLAALTIKTIFGTIAQCTAQVRDLKRNPWAMARRVLANAWFSNWKRFGKMSWWVLGLFISTGLGGPKLREWDWTKYDGEEIAHQVCEPSHQALCRREQLTKVPNSYELSSRTGVAESASTPKQKDGWGKTVMLWGKFSVAIMLAVGGAIVKGPGEMLKEVEEPDIKNLNDTKSSPIRCTRSQCRNDSEPYSLAPFADREIASKQHALQPSLATMSGICPTSFDTSLNTMDNSDRISLSNLDMSRTLRYPAEDDTVRAIPSPRKHVADCFQTNGIGDTVNGRSVFGASLQDQTNPPPSDESMNGKISNWPPSLEPIHTQLSRYTRRRNRRPSSMSAAQFSLSERQC